MARLILDDEFMNYCASKGLIGGMYYLKSLVHKLDIEAWIELERPEHTYTLFFDNMAMFVHYMHSRVFRPDSDIIYLCTKSDEDAVLLRMSFRF